MRSIKMDKIHQNHEKLRYYQQIRNDEEITRQKIIDERNKLKNSVQSSWRYMTEKNQKIGQDIREQKKRIKETIEQNKTNFMEEKKQVFMQKKEMQRNSKGLAKGGGTYGNNFGLYQL